MKSFFQAIAIFLGVLFAIFALMFIIQGQDFFMYKFWAPKYENARRQVFENTKSYTQGMVQELQGMQIQYINADTNHQAAIAQMIIHDTADFPMDILQQRNPDLYQFVQGLKRQYLIGQPQLGQ